MVKRVETGEPKAENAVSAYGELKEGADELRSPDTLSGAIDIEGTSGATGEKRMVINLGPQHPSTHGVLRIITTLEGETVVDALPDIGFLHRNWEKIVESWSFPQTIPFSDRNDYLAPLLNEHALVLAIEKMFNVEPPERARYIRVIMAELSRLASHMIWMGTYGLDLGAVTPFLYGWRDRELIYDVWEENTGKRQFPEFFRIGGVRNDVRDDFPDRVREICRVVKEVGIPQYETMLTDSALFRKRTRGIGVIDREEAINGGASGPVLRGSGVRYDLRKHRSYSIYDRFDFDIPTGEDGDCYSRARVRIQEMHQSVRIIRQALDQLPGGEVLGRVPRVLKVPEDGDVYQPVEGSKGEIGVYLVGKKGQTRPYRAHWRSASFCNLSLLRQMAQGNLLQDLIACIGSIDPVFGSVDR